MLQGKFNGFQLFCVVFLFELGSAILVGLGREAMQDAWITVLMGIVCGCALLLVYLKLYHLYPALSLTGYLRKILGRYLGWFLGLLYVI
jgi:spore germination protein KB